MRQRTCLTTAGGIQECHGEYLVANGTNYTDIYYFNNTLDNILTANGGLVSFSYFLFYVSIFIVLFRMISTVCVVNLGVCMI